MRDVEREATQITYSSLSDECYRRLRHRIINARAMWGQRLDIMQLADEFGVSRAPVIKAIERLAHEGLVTVSPNRGSYVTQPTQTDVRELFEVRRALERAAIEAAWRLNRESLLTRLLENERRMERYEAKGRQLDTAEFLEYDRLFHEIIADCSGNSRLRRFYDIIRGQVDLFRSQTFGEDVARRSLEMHRRVIAGLEAGDLQEALAALCTHIDEVGEGAEQLVAAVERESGDVRQANEEARAPRWPRPRARRGG